VFTLRRVGTMSTAVGFIFLGIWILINQRDAAQGSMLFKWWPVIIVILGMEILSKSNRHEENSKRGFNPLIIFVIAAFLFINIFLVAKLEFRSGFIWFRNTTNFNSVVDILNRVDGNSYKEITTSKTLDADVNKLSIEASNAVIKIYKSEEENIRLDTKVFFDKNREDTSYDIKEQKESDGYSVAFNESYIRKIEVDLYVPDGLQLIFKVNNLQITSNAELASSLIDIDTNNVSVDVASLETIKLKMNNGKLDFTDVKNIVVRSNNGFITTKGDCENINIDLSNGIVNIDNKLSKYVAVEIQSGTINMKTTDNNISVKLDIDYGTCNLNSSRKINSGLSRSFGSGEGKVELKVNHGVINFSN
jgi:hypothetical protein